MAVYTEVTAEDLRALLAGYDIGDLMSLKGIAEGVENSNFFLETGKGGFILTLYERRVRPGDLPFFLGLMEHLSRHGVICPTPVHDRAGKVLQLLAEKPAAIVTFLPGYSIRRPSPGHCQELGAALASLHLAGLNFELKRENTLGPSGWRTLLDGLGKMADKLLPGMSSQLEREFVKLSKGWPKGLPNGVIHADLFPDNVFFLGERISGLIDFYFACNDILAYDLAICLNAWCFEPDHAFNVTKAKALFRGYSQVRTLLPEEIDALPMLARGSALRFLLTRATDWFQTPDTAFVRKKDPLEYWRKLQFHRDVRSPSAYGLS